MLYVYGVYHSRLNSFREADRDVGAMTGTEGDRCSHTWRSLRRVSAEQVRWREKNKRQAMIRNGKNYTEKCNKFVSKAS